MIGFVLYVAALIALARGMLWIIARSWGRPERLDASWCWTRPAPLREAMPIGPTRPPLLPSEPTLPVEHEGATEEWSVAFEIAAADARRLPLDDVEEWLAERLSAFDGALARIDATSGREAEIALRDFVRGSQQLHAYRMINVQTGNYGPREHMQLEALLIA